MKMNNKGYASTIIMFGILALFLVSMLMLIQTMNNSKSLNKNITDKVTDNIDYSASGSLQNEIELLKQQMSNLVDKMYPIGSIYMTTTYTDATQVHDAIGGEWEKYAQGRTIIGEGTGTDSNGLVQTFTNNTSGGEYTHKLTVAEMPSHSHTIDHTHNIASKTYTTSTASLTGTISMHNYSGSTPVHHASGIFKENYIASNYSYVVGLQTSGATSLGIIGIDASHNHTIEIGSHKTESPSTTVSGTTGGNTSFNVQDPYIVTYIYKRVK